MNSSPQQVVIVEPGQIIPENAIVIRRTDISEYLIEATGAHCSIVSQSMLRVDFPVGSSVGTPNLRMVDTENYRFLAPNGQWVALTVSNGQLLVE